MPDTLETFDLAGHDLYVRSRRLTDDHGTVCPCSMCRAAKAIRWAWLEIRAAMEAQAREEQR